MADDTAKPALTDDEIVRRLRTIKYSAQRPRIARRVPGIRTVARYAGLSYRTVYWIINTGRLKPDQAIALAIGLAAVQDWPDKVPRSPRAGPRGL
jgi:lambda repressor-like predicted transcriptional regulator